jgi:uncharacterized oxidoreductase
MNIKGNTVLITGGATGIGFALADAFLGAGNTVIICGRRQGKLDAARNKLRGVHTFTCDVTRKADRQALFRWTEEKFPELNILINNAGVQGFADLKKGLQGLPQDVNEIGTNLVAPIHLAAQYTPSFLKKDAAAIINVTSGLGFVPIASMPIYCATKAALHSFTVSQRQQFKNTPIKVFEIIPPMVATELGGQALSTVRGMKPALLAEETLKAIAIGKFEIPIGEASGLVEGAKTNFEATFQRLNSWG